MLEMHGVDRAVVLVPGSWVSRTVSGLWAAGAPAGLVERATAKLDTCELDGLLRDARRLRLSSRAVTDTLAAMLARSADVVPRVLHAPDPSLRLRGTEDLPARPRLLVVDPGTSIRSRRGRVR